MCKIKEWFNEAKADDQEIFKLNDIEFIIYKGFKIIRQYDTYYIKDVRFNNMYSEVSKKCYSEFVSKGFIKGADNICFRRNRDRILYYKKRAEMLYNKRIKFSKELDSNRRLNEKRIRNLNKNIEESIDHMFLYKTRVNQYKTKYNLN